MNIQQGVMVMKDGKAWGVEYEDGQFTAYGWIDPDDAPIHDPKYCRKPTDVTHKGSPYIQELSTANLVHVTRTTTLTVHDANVSKTQRAPDSAPTPAGAQGANAAAGNAAGLDGLTRYSAFWCNDGTAEMGEDAEYGEYVKLVDVKALLDTAPAEKAVDRDAVRDAVAKALDGIYYCGRDWTAWQYGTMSQDDFTPAAEVDDVLAEITHAAIAAMHRAPAADAGGLAHGHRDDYFVLANARRLISQPVQTIRRMPNWVLAQEVFATGSNSARQICLDAGIDPDGLTVERTDRAAAVGAGGQNG